MTDEETALSIGHLPNQDNNEAIINSIVTVNSDNWYRWQGFDGGITLTINGKTAVVTDEQDLAAEAYKLLQESKEEA